MTLKTIRTGLWALVALVAIFATGAYFFIKVPAPGATGLGSGDYALVDGSGAKVTPATFTGHPSMLFFGFTHCPEVCPTTLSEMAVWYEGLGADADKLKGYFVTVDPERDTPEIVNDYVRAVSDRVTAVSGSPAEIEKMTADWKVYAKKVPTQDGDYTMDHSASVFLIDSRGEFQGTIAYGESNETAVQKLKLLISKG
jgi:protein SCO1/2